MNTYYVSNSTTSTSTTYGTYTISYGGNSYGSYNEYYVAKNRYHEPPKTNKAARHLLKSSKED